MTPTLAWKQDRRRDWNRPNGLRAYRAQAGPLHLFLMGSAERGWQVMTLHGCDPIQPFRRCRRKCLAGAQAEAEQRLREWVARLNTALEETR